MWFKSVVNDGQRTRYHRLSSLKVPDQVKLPDVKRDKEERSETRLIRFSP